jgi:hypothetical protein
MAPAMAAINSSELKYLNTRMVILFGGLFRDRCSISAAPENLRTS